MVKWRILVAAVLVGAGGIYTMGASKQPGVVSSGSYGFRDAAVLVKERVRVLRVAEPQRFGPLTVFPLTGKSIGGLEYLTLDEAMKAGDLQIGEIGSGEVNKVRIRNLSGRRVFIMDGEEIVGAKQNRILNSSVMIAPKQVADVPVSCVEQGRWVASSPSFRSGGTQLFARARQSNTAAVTRNMSAAPSAGAQSDQSKIWEKVAEKRAAFSLAEPSGPMHEVYRKNEKSVGEYLKHFDPVRDQVGAVFAINGEIVGADIFDQNSTLKRLLSKLVKSYALDAMEVETRGRLLVTKESPDREEAERFLRRVLAKGVSFRGYDSPGEGRNVRMSSEDISGAALVASERAVHTALFAPEKDDRPIPLRDGGIRAPSERRQMLRE